MQFLTQYYPIFLLLNLAAVIFIGYRTKDDTWPSYFVILAFLFFMVFGAVFVIVVGIQVLLEKLNRKKQLSEYFKYYFKTGLYKDITEEKLYRFNEIVKDFPDDNPIKKFVQFVNEKENYTFKPVK